MINELGSRSPSPCGPPPAAAAIHPAIEALYVPNMDDALDEETAKREFWGAFRVLGQWWADLPPY